jgi:hypothetical protein
MRLARPLIAASVAAVLAACGPVQVGPPVSPVTLIGTCHITTQQVVRYVYQVQGTGWFWLRSAYGDSAEFYLRPYDLLSAVGRGESWVMWATDLDSGGGVPAPGGHLPAIWPTTECLA